MRYCWIDPNAIVRDADTKIASIAEFHVETAGGGVRAGIPDGLVADPCATWRSVVRPTCCTNCTGVNWMSPPPFGSRARGLFGGTAPPSVGLKSP
jgi:hypothetical protein